MNIDLNELEKLALADIEKKYDKALYTPTTVLALIAQARACKLRKNK